jgi:hypothetical protein
MKKQLTTYILAAFVLQTCAITQPVFAETAREKSYHKQHEANRESEKAAMARTDARVNARQGHSFLAKLDRHKANRERDKAYKHSQEAKTYRSIARHGSY